ncbi:fatty acid conjugase [Vararia minispora EC-137]|uniref:Fatty acid conjugase n=1 Tax=Vararia minispora EC-137 TaxID=1314806 RepID=A0ACB8QZT0_9AGAM|nr:fatty acid conjugase [Vararia minispora EC-137]
MTSHIFRDSLEYERRKATPFSVPHISLAEVHAAVPKSLHKKSTPKALYYVLRSIFFCVFFYLVAVYRMPRTLSWLESCRLHPWIEGAFVWLFWSLYWWWQGVAFAGLWCLGHEAGHGTLSDHDWINHVLGYLLHTFLLVPYYSYKTLTNNTIQKAVGSIERDENYVPRTREDYKLPPEPVAQAFDYHDVFEETPLYTLCRMILMQIFGWQSYLLFNTLGSPMYPEGTNHFSPNSPLFKDHQRTSIAISNVGLTAMACALYAYAEAVGTSAFVRIYLIPYLLANHWIVMLTFLHHSDPTIPHYREKQWTFLRGALATVDRPLLGWVGRFFLHNVSHDHISHHLFSYVRGPDLSYNQPRVTEIVRKVLGNDYNYDSTNTFRALYRSFSECCFVENEGDIVFYKNKQGIAILAATSVAAPHRANTK